MGLPGESGPGEIVGPPPALDACTAADAGTKQACLPALGLRTGGWVRLPSSSANLLSNRALENSSAEHNQPQATLLVGLATVKLVSSDQTSPFSFSSGRAQVMINNLIFNYYSGTSYVRLPSGFR